MGSGVSKPGSASTASAIAGGTSWRHSDSRVDQVRAELAKEEAVHTNGGNSTFTLKLSLQEYTDSFGGPQQQQSQQSPHTKKKRAHSLPGINYGSLAGGVFGKRGPSLSPIQTIGSLEEMQDEVDVSDNHPQVAVTIASSISPRTTPRSSSPTNAAGSPRVNEGDRASTNNEEEEEEEEENYEDDFEDEIGDWKKGDSIGSGSYGTVYLARDERTGGLMAVKEILIAEENDVDISNATKEVDLLRSLRDDHIVKYLGSYVDNDAKKLFIFTEWVPGGNLEQNRKKFGGNETIVRRFTQQILQGVAYLHAKSIVHHDIKPSNILVDQHGIVKLADFGASRLISSSTTVNNESMRGTPNYMAPEVIKQSSRSRKSDIWSVGCSVLRLLTGLPFWGDKKFDSQISLLYYVAHLETLPPLPKELSDDARPFVTACLEIDPVLRPSALELLQHPFVKKIDVNNKATLRSSRNTSNPSRAIRTAPAPAVTTSAAVTDNLSRNPSPQVSKLSPVVAKRVLNSAPSQLNLPRLRNGGGGGNGGNGGALARQDSYVARPLLPNAFDLPEIGNEDGEASIPSFSTTVSPLTQDQSTTPKKLKSHLPLGSITSSSDTSRAEYTFSEFEPVTLQAKLNSSRQQQQQVSPSKWEEQAIVLTDAARAEREQRLAQLASEKLKRERRYQEELAEFRRQMGHH